MTATDSPEHFRERQLFYIYAGLPAWERFTLELADGGLSARRQRPPRRLMRLYA